MKTTSHSLYKHICKKYPNINYNGEDLNLYTMYIEEIKKRWNNRDKYPNITDIVIELRLSERTIHRIAKDNNFGTRWQIKKTI